jgi:hypothetical protein
MTTIIHNPTERTKYPDILSTASRTWNETSNILRYKVPLTKMYSKDNYQHIL